MKELSLREIQMEELNILKSLISVLEENNLQYYLFGGSLLGAVRHEGFIPWDDDIDIAMRREDYNKLLTIARNNKKILNNNLIFSGYEVNEGFYPFLKLENRLIKVEQKVGTDKFLWVDIFPLDYIPDNEKEATKFLKKAYIIHQVISLKLMKFNRVFLSSKTLKNRIIKIFLYPIVYFIDLHKFLSKFVQYCTRYFNKTNTIGNVCWCLNEKEGMNSKILEVSKYKFENIEVDSFKDYDYYLKRIYGDYMKLPPKNKRYTHCLKAYKEDFNINKIIKKKGIYK